MNVKDFLEDCGFGFLATAGDEVRPNILDGCLRELQKRTSELDAISTAGVREFAIKHLAEVGLKSPTRLVDAALEPAVRKVAENDLQGRPIVLAEPEPWPDPVDGAELLEDIAAAFQRFVILTDSAAPALALWTVHTHALEVTQISPILVITSPEKRCAKTLTLEILQLVVYKPLPAANISTAAVFRTVEKYTPTLLIDEADSFLPYNEELRGVLNSGHRRRTAVVVRTVGDEHEPRTFSTWCPKAIALIGKLPGTLEDRAVVIHQRRKAPGEHVERWRSDRISADVETLRRKTARWVTDHLNELRAADPEVPQELDDRQADNWRPLLAIADAAGGEWPQRARKAAQFLSGGTNEEENSARIQLLADIHDLFDSRKVDRIQSGEIVEALIEMEERPWPEWKRGKPITKRQLAKLLQPFKISPKQVWIDGKNSRGYERTDFEESFSRYTPPTETLEPIEPSVDRGVRNIAETLGDGKPNVPENAGNPHEQCILSDLTDPKGVAVEERYIEEEI